MNVLREDLQAVMRQWNIHRIRPSAGAVCPAGIPDILYWTPSPPAVDCSTPVSPAMALPPQLQADIRCPSVCADADFGSYMHYLCLFHGWQAPHNTDEALQLYFKLCPLVRD
jgi:hypothetical protein